MENTYFFIIALLIYFFIDKILEVFEEKYNSDTNLTVADATNIIILIASPIIKNLKNDKSKTTKEILTETYASVIKMVDIKKYKKSLGLTDEGLRTFISSIILELYNQT